MSNEDGRTTEEWTFGGSRVGPKKTRIHAWIDPSGNEILFKANGSYAVGSVYRATVKREESNISLYGRPEFLHQSENADLIEKVSAKHRAAEVTLQKMARERAAKKSDPVEEAIADLARLAKSVPASQRSGFVAYVMQRLMNEW